jgi:hypothetical protein
MKKVYLLVKNINSDSQWELIRLPIKSNRLSFRLGFILFVVLLAFLYLNKSSEDHIDNAIAAVHTTIKNQSLHDYQTIKHDYVKFRYKDDIHSDLMLSYIDETETNSKSFLDLSSLPELQVIFYDKKSEFENATSLKDIAAFYDDRDQSINVMADYESGEVQDLLRSISHEYVHYYFNAVLAENKIDPADIPVWFHEGVAEYISHVNRKYAEVSYGFLPFQEQDTNEEWAAARKSAVNPYHQAYIAVQELVKLKGNEAIQQLINLVREDVDFYTALEQTANMNISTFEKVVHENIFTD